MQNDASCSSMRRRALCWCMKRPVYRCLVSCGNARLRALCCCRKLSMQSTGMPTPTLDLPICQWLHAPSHQAAASFPLPRPVGAEEEEEAMHEAKFVGPPGIPGGPAVSSSPPPPCPGRGERYRVVDAAAGSHEKDAKRRRVSAPPLRPAISVDMECRLCRAPVSTECWASIWRAEARRRWVSGFAQPRGGGFCFAWRQHACRGDGRRGPWFRGRRGTKEKNALMLVPPMPPVSAPSPPPRPGRGEW